MWNRVGYDWIPNWRYAKPSFVSSPVRLWDMDSLPTTFKMINIFHTSWLRKLLKIKWQDRILDTNGMQRAETTSTSSQALLKQVQLTWLWPDWQAVGCRPVIFIPSTYLWCVMKKSKHCKCLKNYFPYHVGSCLNVWRLIFFIFLLKT